MADHSLDPVVLPGWPTSTTNNLSWSEEHLAVAAGEVVHILTPRNHLKSSTPRTGHWHVETIRVNQFTEQEWPLFELTTLKYLSLGEEQSQSSVCGLAWSPSEIGVHRRAVLAVLTTNLRLSIWESSGTPGSWLRTCVINHQLKENARTKLRVRAFAWLPTLHLSEDDRKGQQYLVTVDDDDTLSVFHVKKTHSFMIGGWDISVVYKHGLPRDASSPVNGISLLQRALQSSPITEIKSGNWQQPDIEDAGFRVNISFWRGGNGLPCPDLILACQIEQGLHLFDGQATTSHVDNDSQSTQLSEELEAALANSKSNFDEHFDLQGHVRVRHWGTANSPDGTKSVACVSFHPSDMIEYNVPSTERCTVVFARIQGAKTRTMKLSDKDARLELLHWITTHAGIETIKTELDAKIVRVAAACIQSAYSTHIGLMEWSDAAKELASNFETATDTDENGDANIERESQFVQATVIEPCEICNAAISTSEDLTSARCSNGHTFARCGISFLSIQEPGISKYCSQCGRQFLSIFKLEPQGGPSLGAALFEEFDRCPYCRGKFRD